MRKLFNKVDNVTALNIGLSLFALIASIILPWYFEYRATANTAVRVEELRQDKYSLGSEKSSSKSSDKDEMSSRVGVPEEFGITINRKAYDYAVIGYWKIMNTGRRPLTASDFIDPITVSVKAGSKFLIVKSVNCNCKNIPMQHWKLSGNSSVATFVPDLLNPGDEVIVCIAYEYVPRNPASVGVEWNARITGLNKLAVDDFKARSKLMPSPFNMMIYYSGYEIFVLVFIALSLFASVMTIAYSKRRLPTSTIKDIMLMIIIMTFSLCSAEIMANWIFRPKEVAWSLCASLLIMHAVAILLILLLPPRKVVLKVSPPD